MNPTRVARAKGNASMETGFDLTAYLNRGAEILVGDILRATLTNPKEAAFLAKYHSRQRQTEKRRMEYEARGLHIPMFLIASITDACNLYCKGCYARANGQCGKRGGEAPLTDAEWDAVFRQAEDAGVGFVLLAGGEPFLRPDVLAAAARREGILFPIFTNGTLLTQDTLRLLDRNRNLVPVVSLEGGEAATDGRRGEGVYRQIGAALDEMAALKLLFGVSVTVTTENLTQVIAPEFIQPLYQKGCRLAFLIEYVPVAPGTERLAPGDAERAKIEEAQAALRERFPGMVILSFPGDEKYIGGCLAAGRGFFHINAHGGAEPCPFAPYSDTSLRTRTLLEALQSPFFQKVRALNAREDAQEGGCALFAREAQVRSLLFPAESAGVCVAERA
jgi:MoaA/NifB/PqqE/SkfB family radical SAM enzyme